MAHEVQWCRMIYYQYSYLGVLGYIVVHMHEKKKEAGVFFSQYRVMQGTCLGV